MNRIAVEIIVEFELEQHDYDQDDICAQLEMVVRDTCPSAVFVQSAVTREEELL